MPLITCFYLLTTEIVPFFGPIPLLGFFVSIVIHWAVVLTATQPRFRLLKRFTPLDHLLWKLPFIY